MSRWKRATWAANRAAGMKRCIYRMRDTVKAREYPDGRRQTGHKKGAQCTLWCSSERVARVGLPICGKHEAIWEEEVKRDAEARARVRAKLDPGPLYDDD